MGAGWVVPVVLPVPGRPIRPAHQAGLPGGPGNTTMEHRGGQVP